MTEPEPIDWPTEPGTWWWMRDDHGRVYLVRMRTVAMILYAEPWKSRGLYTREMCDARGARFLPAEGPPSQEDWER